MNKHILNATFLFLLAVLAGCGPDQRDIRDYYFPVRELNDGMVYVYEPLAGTDSLPLYWYALGLDRDTSLYLVVTTYGADGSPASLVREEITNPGVITRELTLYTTDTTGRSIVTEADVVAGNAFPFYVDDAERPAYVYRVRYTPPDQPKSSITVTYNRQFARDTIVQFNGQEYPAIRLLLTGETDINDPVNGSISPAFTGYEIYARGLGLFESYRSFDGGFVFHNLLRERISMTELQGRIGQ